MHMHSHKGIFYTLAYVRGKCHFFWQLCDKCVRCSQVRRCQQTDDFPQNNRGVIFYTQLLSVIQVCQTGAWDSSDRDMGTFFCVFSVSTVINRFNIGCKMVHKVGFGIFQIAFWTLKMRFGFWYSDTNKDPSPWILLTFTELTPALSSYSHGQLVWPKALHSALRKTPTTL